MTTKACRNGVRELVLLAAGVGGVFAGAAGAATYDLTSASDLRTLYGLGSSDPVQVATANDYSDDDGPVITAAMDAASAGDVLTLPAGIFHLKAQADLESDIELRGAGASVTTLAATYGGSGRLLAITSETGTTVSAMRLKTNNSTVGLRHLVYVTDSVDITVEDCILQRFQRLVLRGLYGQHS